MSYIAPVRRQSLVASVVLTAAFATLVALPGVAGSQTPSTVRPLTAERSRRFGFQRRMVVRRWRSIFLMLGMSQLDISTTPRP